MRRALQQPTPEAAEDLVLEGLIRNLTEKLQAADANATYVPVDVGMVRAAIERLTVSDDLKHALDQAQEQLSLKPSVAKKLADQIKQLKADLEVLRSNSRVTELEKKLQVLQAELKQSYLTKNFALKSGILEVEKRYRDLIYGGSEALQDLWADVTWLLAEDKDALPADIKARHSAKLNELAHGPPSAHHGSPVAAPNHAGDDATVHNHVDRLRDATLPPDFGAPAAALPRDAVRVAANIRASEGRGLSETGSDPSADALAPAAAGVEGSSSSGAGLGAMREAFAGGSALLPPAPGGSTQDMLRPLSLHQGVYGPVDASGLQLQSEGMFASLMQLRQHFRSFSHHPAPAAATSGRQDGAASPRPSAAPPAFDAQCFEQQAEQLRASVLQLRALYAGGGPIAPSGAPGAERAPTSALHEEHPDARYFEAQADEALTSIEHLQRMYHQYAAASSGLPYPGGGAGAGGPADSGGSGGSGSRGAVDALPDARYFDDQMLQLTASLQHMRGMLPAAAAVEPAAAATHLSAAAAAAAARSGHHSGGGNAVLPRRLSGAALTPAAALHHRASELFASLLQLREQSGAFPASQQQALGFGTNSVAVDGGVLRGVDAARLDRQAGGLRAAVVELRGMYSAAAAAAAHAEAGGSASSSESAALTLEAQRFEAQAEAAFRSLDSLQRMYQHYAQEASSSAAAAAGGASHTPSGGAVSAPVSSSPGGGDSSSGGGGSGGNVPPTMDAGQFDGQLQALATSLQQLQGLLPTTGGGGGGPGVPTRQQGSPLLGTVAYASPREWSAPPPEVPSSQPDGSSGAAPQPAVSAMAQLSAHFLTAVAPNGGAAAAAATDGVAGADVAAGGSSNAAVGDSDAAAVTTAAAAPVDDLSRRFAQYLQAAALSSSDNTASATGRDGFSEEHLAEARRLLNSLGLLPAGSSAAGGTGGTSGMQEGPALPRLPVEDMVAAFGSVVSELRLQGKLPAAGAPVEGTAADSTASASSSSGGLDAGAAATATATADPAASSSSGDGTAATPAAAVEELAAMFDGCLQQLQATDPSPLAVNLTAPRPAATTASTALPIDSSSGDLALAAAGSTTAVAAVELAAAAAASGTSGGSSGEMANGGDSHAVVMMGADGRPGLAVSGWPYSSSDFGAAAPMSTPPPRVVPHHLPDYEAEATASLQDAFAAAAAQSDRDATQQQQQQQQLVETALHRVSEKHAALLSTDSGAAELWRDVEAALGASAASLRQSLPAAATAAAGSSPFSSAPPLPGGAGGSSTAAKYAGLTTGRTSYSGPALAVAAADRPSPPPASSEIEVAADQPPRPADFFGSKVRPEDHATEVSLLREVKKELSEKVTAYAHTIRELSGKLEGAINRADDSEFMMMQKSTELRRAESSLERLNQESMGWRLELIDAKIRMAEKGEEQARMVKKIAQSSSEQKVLVDIQEDLRTLLAGLQAQPHPVDEALLNGLQRVMRSVRQASNPGAFSPRESASGWEAAFDGAPASVTAPALAAPGTADKKQSVSRRGSFGLSSPTVVVTTPTAVRPASYAGGPAAGGGGGGIGAGPSPTLSAPPSAVAPGAAIGGGVLRTMTVSANGARITPAAARGSGGGGGVLRTVLRSPLPPGPAAAAAAAGVGAKPKA